MVPYSRLGSILKKVSRAELSFDTVDEYIELTIHDIGDPGMHVRISFANGARVKFDLRHHDGVVVAQQLTSQALMAG
jgi:hypothetical protein